MTFPPAIEDAIANAGAIVRVGYPPWLRLFVARDVAAITLGRRIYLRPDVAARPAAALGRLLRHELVHVRQVNRHGLFLFLARYAGEFLGHLIRERSVNKAYRRISFEVEAWAEEERRDV